MAVPYPLNEIYHHVLTEGWKIEELWRKNGEIRIVIYMHNAGMEDFMKRTGHTLEDCLGQLKHLELSIYESD